MSKNKQKIQCYKFKRQFGICYTCGSFEHKNAQCPVREILKYMKSRKNAFNNKREFMYYQEQFYQRPYAGSQSHSMMLDAYGQCSK